MSAEENKVIIQRFFDEVWNEGRLDRVDDLEHPNSMSHGYVANPEFGVGLEGTKRFVAAYRTAFPDIRVVIEDMVADGDKVAVCWLARGTHTGQLLNFSPTGKEVVTTGTFFYRLADAKIAEVWGDWDRLGFMEQVSSAPSR
jgi:steroid delta-isomerase-like uncharacterized protein